MGDGGGPHQPPALSQRAAHRKWESWLAAPGPGHLGAVREQQWMPHCVGKRQAGRPEHRLFVQNVLWVRGGPLTTQNSEKGLRRQGGSLSTPRLTCEQAQSLRVPGTYWEDQGSSRAEPPCVAPSLGGELTVPLYRTPGHTSLKNHPHRSNPECRCQTIPGRKF